MGEKIKELQEYVNIYGEDTKIVCESNDIEMNGCIVDSSKSYPIYMKKDKRCFTDAFDYTEYTSEVYVIDNDKEVCNVVIVNG